MADQQLEPSKVSSTFPLPPPFWHEFRPEKLARVEELRRTHARQQGVQPASVIRMPEVPGDLIYLQPPAEPADGNWRVFGESYALQDELQSLEQAGIQRLGPASDEVAGERKDGKHADRAFELKKMAKSLLLNFLELMGVMSTSPSQGTEKVEDLRTLFINFHHVLNEYRPHQARESLIALMQDQLDRKRAETAAVRGVVDKAKRVLEGLGSIEASPPPAPRVGPATTGIVDRTGASELRSNRQVEDTTERKKRDDPFWERERGLWEAMDAELV